MSKTIEQIVNAADAEIRRLQVVERDLTSEVNRLLDIEFERPLTKQEISRIVELRRAKSAALSAMEELGFMTLRALDQAPEVERLRKSIARVRGDLAAEVKRVKTIGKVATIVAQVLSGLDKIAGQLVKLVPSPAPSQ